jgi:hypothetical protein
MDRADIAILISVLSFGIACAALAWNIFRELWLRPRLRVSVDVVVLGSEVMKPENNILICGTNFGPGKIRINTIRVNRKSVFSRFKRGAKYGVLIHDYKNPISGKLPITLDIGERVDLIFPFEKGCFLAQKPSHIGLSDYFGREHWAPKKALRQAQAEYDKAFGSKDS